MKPVAIVVEATGLVRRFGAILAVDDVSFDVRRGEVFGLLGPNGAGKTTTIGLLSGVLAPDAGRVVIGGEPDPSRPDVRRSLGVAPQELALYETLTARENLAFLGRLYGLAGDRLDERVDDALAFAGLEERADDRVETFSGGMKRRLNLAAALVHEPPVLFLDEPTVGVDPQSRNRIFESIRSLAESGTTILYTTHYMEEAERLCDRVAIIDHGRILALDTIDGLVAAHGGHAVVTAELGASPVGALPGELDDRRVRVETDRPLEAVAAIVEAGVPLLHLEVERAGLETVFLNLTGRRLRDR